MRHCPGCPGHVPVVSSHLARAALLHLPESTSPLDVIAHAVGWLTNRDRELFLYLGKTGEQTYAREEVLAVEAEVWRASELPCPFAMPTGCALGGLCTPGEWAAEPRHGPWLFLPTALLRLLDRPLLRDLVERRLVADAKVARLLRRDQFPIVLPRAEGPYLATPTSRALDTETEKERTDEFVPPRVPARSD